MTEISGFKEIHAWLLSAADALRPPARESALGDLSSADLESLAACLDDVRVHCGHVRDAIDRLLKDLPTNDRMDSLSADVQVQLALAVRNWRETKDLLQKNDLFPDGPDLFEELSSFEPPKPR